VLQQQLHGEFQDWNPPDINFKERIFEVLHKYGKI
jgi:hypothetical protein